MPGNLGKPDRLAKLERWMAQPWRWVVGYFIAAAAVILMVTGPLEQNDYNLTYSEIDRKLSEIGRDEGLDLSWWRNERMKDAGVLARTHLLRHLIVAGEPAAMDATERTELFSFLREFSASYGYPNIFVYNAKGDEIIHLNGQPTLPAEVKTAIAQDVLENRSSRMGDLFMSASGASPMLSVASPIMDNAGTQIGLVVLLIDPTTQLYTQVLQLLHDPASLEVYLTKRDGNDIILLSPLRSGKVSVLQPIGTMDQTWLPSAKGLMGTTGLVAGVDYRGAEVFAYVAQVPSSNWVLVAKGDQAELLAEYTVRRRNTLVSVLGFFIMVGLSLYSIYTFSQRQSLARVVQAQQKTEQAQGELSSALNAITDGFIVADAAGLVSRVNQTALAMLGQSREGLIGTPLQQAILLGQTAESGTDAPTLQPISLPAEGHTAGEGIWHCADGIKRVIAYTISAVPGAAGLGAGAPGGWVLVFRDRTVELQAEKREREREALITTIVDNAPVGIWVRDKDMRMILENKYMVRMYGKRQGQTLDEMTNTPVPKEQWRADNAIVMQGQIVEKDEAQTVNGENRIIHKVLAPLITNGTVEGIVGFNFDITGLKQAEAELLREREELRRSNTDLEQFAYVASHDLQEPLRMVSIYLQLLEKRYKGKLDDRANEFIAYAVDGAGTMQRLILDLLEYSRVGARGQDMQPMPASEAVHAALRNLHVAVAESKAQINVGTLPDVFADRSMLTLAFQNLIANAIKFAKPGQPPQIFITCVEEPEGCHFRVRDEGIGLDPRFAERIFVLFQRLSEKGQYPGTGIGLAVCKKIIDRHGGRIWVESNPGEGATFHFTLPRKAEENE